MTRLPEVGLAPVEARFHQGVNGLFAIGGLTGAVIAVLMGVFLARRATAPERSLAKAARALAAGDRSQRVPDVGDDEFGQMGQAFNAMAEAIDEEDRLRRNFAAAEAHEVRTPLSILRSEIEALQVRLVRPPEPSGAGVASRGGGAHGPAHCGPREPGLCRRRRLLAGSPTDRPG